MRTYEKECGITLTKEQKQRAHDAARQMKGKGGKLGFGEIVDLLKGMYGCPKEEGNEKP